MVGIGILLAASIVMPWLASQKRQLSVVTSSAALCGYMAWIALAGLCVNAFWHKPRAAPVAALALVPLIVREGLEAVRSARLGCHCAPIP
jgi:hypothetical protein